MIWRRSGEFKELQACFGYRFRRPQLLRRALTHRSYANENNLPAEAHNERLEFLGDAVLELAISELLMSRYPNFTEGELSKLRAAIVNERQLAELAQKYRIGEFLLLGRGEDQTAGRKKPSLLSDAYEAVLGAIYLDRGYKRAKKVIESHYGELFTSRTPESFYSDYKTELQERVQGIFRTIPQYRLTDERGPDHRKTFEVEILIQMEVYGRGIGKSKKEAEQKAAQEALKKLEKDSGVEVGVS